MGVCTNVFLCVAWFTEAWPVAEGVPTCFAPVATLAGPPALGLSAAPHG